MPDLIDFYEVFVLHVIAVRIAVPWFYKDVITACRLNQILIIFCSILT